MQGKKHLTEKLFLSFQLSQRVPADNFYRRLKDQLDLHFVYKSTKKYYGMEEQQSIDPVVFFKLTYKILQNNLDKLSDLEFVFTKTDTLEKQELVKLGFEQNLYYQGCIEPQR
ncbi:hypothetical protein [Agriterribacter humi]|jgi:hypothetical protein|uniref:hypothetical protein n=1 Tax=Agriterribacter humi TaxID=1104781 RepID=UPI00186B0716|nr:hypothetical protein [Agriterribacter humi]